MKREKIESFEEYKKFAHQMLDDESLCIGYGEQYEEVNGHKVYNQCYQLTFEEAFFDNFVDYEKRNHEELEESLECFKEETLDHMKEVQYYKFS